MERSHCCVLLQEIAALDLKRSANIHEAELVLFVRVRVDSWIVFDPAGKSTIQN